MSETATDLRALLEARIAEKIQAGKRPSKADLEWLDALREAVPSQSHAERTRNAKGDWQYANKVYHVDPFMADKISYTLAEQFASEQPLSLTQEHARKTLPADKAPTRGPSTKPRPE